MPWMGDDRDRLGLNGASSSQALAGMHHRGEPPGIVLACRAWEPSSKRVDCFALPWLLWRWKESDRAEGSLMAKLPVRLVDRWTVLGWILRREGYSISKAGKLAGVPTTLARPLYRSSTLTAKSQYWLFAHGMYCTEYVRCG